MDYHLENKIVLSEESEYKSLYSWSLQELDKSGQKIGLDQIPWAWSLYFTASEFLSSYSLVVKDEPTKEKEHISAKLHPGICRDGKWKRDVSYSMFGTARRIKSFELCISKIEENKDNKDNKDSKKCHIWGSPSYTTEIDFRNETTEDIVIINLYVSDQQFYKLVDLIKLGRIDILEIRLNGVSGFYSEWSPAISTNHIKILTDDSKDQKVIMKDGCKIEPPRLGAVGEFNITAIQRHKLNPKQDVGIIDVDQLFEEPENEDLDEQNEEKSPDKNTLILTQLVRNEEALNKLSTPLWLIFMAFCALLIKFWI